MELPEDDCGRKTELCDGRVIFMGQPGEQHADVAMRLLLALHQFVSVHRLGKVRNDVGFLLRSNPDRVVAPDVGFVDAAALPANRDPKRHFPVPPTLAVEVVSPGDTDADVFSKMLEYLDAGTARVRVVRPASHSVTVHGQDRTERTIRTGVLMSEDAGFTVPGFELQLDEIFSTID